MLVCFPISRFSFNGRPGDLLFRFHEFNIIMPTDDPGGLVLWISGSQLFRQENTACTPAKKRGNYRETDDNRRQLPTTQRVAYGKRYCHVTGFGIITNHFFHMKVNPSVHKKLSYMFLFLFLVLE